MAMTKKVVYQNEEFNCLQHATEQSKMALMICDTNRVLSSQTVADVDGNCTIRLLLLTFLSSNFFS
jgi:hypothetical protein